MTSHLATTAPTDEQVEQAKQKAKTMGYLKGNTWHWPKA